MTAHCPPVLQLGLPQGHATGAGRIGYTWPMRLAQPTHHSASTRLLAGWRMVLLCVMMALMPVRSWAWTTMAVQTALPSAHEVGAEPSAAAQVAQVAQVAQAEASPHCHAHAEMTSDTAAASEAPSVQAALGDGGSSSGTPHHGCSSCDLCHAGALPWHAGLWSGAAVPPCSAPGWTPATDTGRQGSDGLFRPPRR